MNHFKRETLIQLEIARAHAYTALAKLQGEHMMGKVDESAVKQAWRKHEDLANRVVVAGGNREGEGFATRKLV